MKTFVTLFPSYMDFHFFKDPGQIPFRLNSLGYKTKIVTFNNDTDYSNTLKNCEIDFLENGKKIKSNNKSIAKYIFENAKKIDILNVYHIEWGPLLAGYIYKIRNRKGIIYLKMDNCSYTTVYDWEKNLKTPFYDTNIKQWLKRSLIKFLFIKKIDLFSVEDIDSLNKYSKYKEIRNKIFCSYNGYTNDLFKIMEVKSFSDKSNIILTVGNIGNYSKATEVILESFVTVSKHSNWDLHLAGPINPDFNSYIESYFHRNPDLRKRIVFHGQLKKEPLFHLYNNAKLFVLPSRWEGFANVFSEAMYFKNAIITTKYVSPREIIRDKCGLIIEKPDPQLLSDSIISLIEQPEKLEMFAEYSHKFAIENLNWDMIAKNIDKKINE